MNEFWKFIIQVTSVIGAITTISIFAIKQLIKHIFDKQLSEFKNNLEKSAFEHQIIFSKLHEKKVIVIAEIFKKLVNAYKSLADFIHSDKVAGSPLQEDLYKIAVMEINKFISYYSANEIYFDEKTFNLLKKFINENKNVLYDFSAVMAHIVPPIDDWMKAINKFEKNVEALKKELTNIFREKLGVKEEEKEGTSDKT